MGSPLEEERFQTWKLGFWGEPCYFSERNNLFPRNLFEARLLSRHPPRSSTPGFSTHLQKKQNVQAFIAGISATIIGGHGTSKIQGISIDSETELRQLYTLVMAGWLLLGQWVPKKKHKGCGGKEKTHRKPLDQQF